MPGGSQQEALLAVVDKLCAELGYADGQGEPLGARSPLSGINGSMSGALSPEDESLVAEMRRSLAKLAAAAGAGRPDRGPKRAVYAALDGAELVMRGELVSGNAAQLPRLMSSFVFLVALPIVEQDEALELSRRTSELIEGALGS